MEPRAPKIIGESIRINYSYSSSPTIYRLPGSVGSAPAPGFVPAPGYGIIIDRDKESVRDPVREQAGRV